MDGSGCHAVTACGGRVLVFADHVVADRLLELEHQPGPDRVDDGRGAALLAMVGSVRYRCSAG
jgi:hypothetical protein